MADLSVNVVLAGPNGSAVCFEAGTAKADLPKWAVEEIGEHCYATPVDLLSPPPKSGKGSGLDAWRTYAAGKGVVVDPDASRDEIEDALDAAGVPTE